MIHASTLRDLWKCKPKKTKYNNVVSMRGERKFHSKLEARYYDLLQARKLMGEVKFFLMQVPIQLPGNVKYVIDFVVFMQDGTYEFVEIKGKMTDIARLKIKQAEDLYPIKITILTSKELK